MCGVFASLLKGKSSNGSKEERSSRSQSKGKNTHGSGHEPTKEAGFQKALTGGLLTKATVLKNETKQTLYLRDKVGAAYGATRYQIPANSSMNVTPLQHTFFRMLAYAVEDDANQGNPNTEEGTPEGTKPSTKMSTDTNLTIDSDQLMDNSEIRIVFVNGKFDLRFKPR